jgi:hypothetical protein
MAQILIINMTKGGARNTSYNLSARAFLNIMTFLHKLHNRYQACIT